MQTGLVAVGAALAVGLSGLGVSLGQSFLAKTSIEVLGKNPKLQSTLMIYTLLGLALVESAVIYGFIISFKILDVDALDGITAIGAGLAIGITGFGAGFGEGKIVAASLESINRNPENKTKVIQFMFLFLALVESVAIYGLIISLKLIG